MSNFKKIEKILADFSVTLEARRYNGKARRWSAHYTFPAIGFNSGNIIAQNVSAESLRNILAAEGLVNVNITG